MVVYRRDARPKGGHPLAVTTGARWGEGMSDPRGGQPSPRQRAAAAAKKGGGKVLRNVTVTLASSSSAPKGTMKMIATILRGYSRGFTPSEDQRTITANISREQSGKLLYSIRKMMPDENMIRVTFVQNGTDITANVLRDAKNVAKEQASVKLSPELAERAAAARAAAAAAGDPSALGPVNPFEGRDDGEAEEDSEAEDESPARFASAPQTHHEPSRPPSQAEASTWGWSGEPKGPPKMKPGVTFTGPRFAGLDTTRTDEPEAWVYGAQYRPQDEEKLETLSRKAFGPKDHKSKIKITLGPDSDRRYVIEFARTEGGVWVAYRMGADYADRKEVGRGQRFGAAVHGIIEHERKLWAPRAPKVKAQTPQAQTPQVQTAPVQTAPAQTAPAPEAFIMCMLVPGGRAAGDPRWAVVLRDQVIAVGDDLEVVLAQAKTAVPSALLVVGWNGTLPRPVFKEAPALAAGDVARLAEAMAAAKGPKATVVATSDVGAKPAEGDLGVEDLPWTAGFPVAAQTLREVLDVPEDDFINAVEAQGVSWRPGMTLSEALARTIADVYGVNLVVPASSPGLESAPAAP